MSQRRSRKNIKGFNGIRGIGTLAVLFYHLFPNTFKGGFLAVNLFFVLSGYLLYYTAETDVRTFYRKRIRRIYPALFLIVFITMGLFQFLDASVIDSKVWEILSIFGGYNNFYQIQEKASYFTRMETSSPFTNMWCIAIEMQFYLLWPWLYKLYQKCHRNNLLWIVPMAVSMFLCIVLYQPDRVTNVYYSTLTRMFALFAGVWLCCLPVKPIPEKTVKAGFWISLSASIALWFVMDGTAGYTYHFGLILSTALYVLLLYTIWLMPRFGYQLDRKPLVWIGKHSLEIYLWQYPLIFLNTYLKWQLPAVLMVIIILTIAAWTHWFYPVFLGFLQRLHVNSVRKGLLYGVSFAMIFLLFTGCYALLSDDNRKANDRKDLAQNLERNKGLLEQQTSGTEPFAEKFELPSSTNTLPPVNLDSITFIGDSVLLGAADELKTRIPSCYIDAEESRQVYETSDLLTQLETSGNLGKTVVVALGTNGLFEEQYGQQIIDRLGKNRRIFWVNTYGTYLDWQDPVNAVIQDIVDQNANVSLIDWADEGKEHPEWFYADGIHLNPDGRSGYAQFILDTLNTADAKQAVH